MNSFEKHAKELVKWVKTHLVNRSDCYGSYYTEGNCTKHKWLTDYDYYNHFQDGDNKIGLHCYGKDGYGKWTVIDIDNHGEHTEEATNTNLNIIKEVTAKLDSMGLRYIVEKTNKKASFHIWIVFAGKLPLQALRKVGLIALDGKVHEVFPKSYIQKRCGNYVRVFGQHHKHKDCHSKAIVNGNEVDLVPVVLSFVPNPIESLPAEARGGYDEKLHKDAVKLKGVIEKGDREDFIEQVKKYSGDIKTLDLVCMCDEKDLLEGSTQGEWNAVHCPNHKEHTTGDSLAWVKNGTDGGYPSFWCCHAHCKSLGLMEYLGLFEPKEVDSYCAEKFKKVKEDGSSNIRKTIFDICLQSNLWHDAEDCYITDKQGINYRLGEKKSYEILISNLYDSKGLIATKADIDNILPLLQMKTIETKPEKNCYSRVVRVGDKIIIDKGDKKGTIIEVSKDGWKEVVTDKVAFVRTCTTGEIRTPTNGERAKPEDLKKIFNIADNQIPLLIAIMLDCWKGRGGYWVGLVLGQQGLGKSKFVRWLIEILDPQIKVKGKSINLLPAPSKREEIFFSTLHQFIVGFDNVSYIDNDVSDAICSVATSVATRSRELYTNGGLYLSVHENPVWLCGIDNFAVRGDLLDRTLAFTLQPFAGNRLTDSKLEALVDKLVPSIVGMLLDYLVVGLRNENVDVDTTHRMAESFLWGKFCGIENFEQAFLDNKASINETMIENSPFLQSLITYFDSLQLPAEVTITEMFETMRENHLKKTNTPYLDKKHPLHDVQVFNRALGRAMTSMQQIGFTFTKTERKTTKTRRPIFVINKAEVKAESESSESSFKSAFTSKPLENRASESSESSESTFLKTIEKRGGMAIPPSRLSLPMAINTGCLGSAFTAFTAFNPLENRVEKAKADSKPLSKVLSPNCCGLAFTCDKWLSGECDG